MQKYCFKISSKRVCFQTKLLLGIVITYLALGQTDKLKQNTIIGKKYFFNRFV